MKAGTAGGFPDKRGDTEKVYGTMNSCPRVSRFRDGGERKMKRNGMKTGWMLTAMFALVLVLTLAFGLTGPGAAAETTYIDDDGDTVSADAEILTSSTVTLVSGVYTANKNLTINRRVTKEKFQDLMIDYTDKCRDIYAELSTLRAKAELEYLNSNDLSE